MSEDIRSQIPINIDGSTALYGVIGDPISHTLSPLLHNAVFKARGVNAVYLPFKVNEDYLPMAMEGLKALGISGINITVPHKQQAVYYVDAMLRPMDKAIGAINTIVFNDDRMLGVNTDGMGFIEDLRLSLDFSAKDSNILVLGAGGASRAVCFSLLEEGAKKLFLHNRTLERARGLAEYILKFFPDKEIEVVESGEEFLESKLSLIVNTTSCGMKKDDPFPINPEVLKQCECLYDLIYAPAETMLMKESKELGLRVCGGIGMLIHQAVFAHRYWFPDASKDELYSIMYETYRTWSSVSS